MQANALIQTDFVNFGEWQTAKPSKVVEVHSEEVKQLIKYVPMDS